MTTKTSAFPSVFRATAEDAVIAQDCCQRLARFSNFEEPELRICSSGLPEETIRLPSSMLQVLSEALKQMALGHEVTLVANDAELTTEQAAELLHVSRPFVVDRMESGEIPFKTVGTHRRIRFQDVMSYKRRVDEQRVEALSELSAIDQELGLGY